jgi:hypothetical protein
MAVAAEYGEDLSRLVRRSPEGEGRKGLTESSPVRSAGK